MEFPWWVAPAITAQPAELGAKMTRAFRRRASRAVMSWPDGEGGAEQKHKRQRIENERKDLVEKHFDVTWEKLNLDLRACLYYRLVDEGKAKAPEEDEENMFANDAANSR